MISHRSGLSATSGLSCSDYPTIRAEKFECGQIALTIIVITKVNKIKITVSCLSYTKVVIDGMESSDG